MTALLGVFAAILFATMVLPERRAELDQRAWEGVLATKEPIERLRALEGFRPRSRNSAWRRRVLEAGAGILASARANEVLGPLRQEGFPSGFARWRGTAVL